jgi:hypothetical protein
MLKLPQGAARVPVDAAIHATVGRSLQTLLLLVVLGASGCSDPLQLGPGQYAATAPRQSPSNSQAFDLRGYRLAPQARFDGTGKILSKRRYRWDRLAALVPWDIALGWGVLSDERHLQTLRFTQGDRYMFWDDWARSLPREVVDRSSANIHLIPASMDIADALAEVPVGAVVRLTGELVDAHDLKTRRRYFTSLSRTDIGGGACEILFLTGFEIVHPRSLRRG